MNKQQLKQHLSNREVNFNDSEGAILDARPHLRALWQLNEHAANYAIGLADHAASGCKEFNKLISIRPMVWLYLNEFVDNNIKHKIVADVMAHDHAPDIDNIKHFVHNHVRQTIRDKKL